MSRNNVRRQSNADVLGAGATGGGIGTFIAVVANGLPEGSSWKTLMTASAPMLTVGISAIGLFLKTVYINPYTARRKHDADQVLLQRVIDDARKTYQNALQDPNATQQHKDKLRKEVEKLEQLMMQGLVQKLEIRDDKVG
jgi:hypothetical protein